MKSEFLDIMKSILGSEYDAFVEALNRPQSTSVRINNKVPSSQLSVLEGANPIEYCSTGFSLTKRPDFTLDPMLHAGAYYVQEASSIYLETIVKKYVSGKVLALDLCAAPGGKSTHLASLLSADSLLVSNEIMPQRANILAENITKWGNVNTIVTNNKPSDFSKACSLFDIVLTDVPCSGEGMFRKEPKAVEDWSVDAVAMCAQRQRSILSDIWDSLKCGGLLIYSTCTFNPSEDEDNVRWIASELGAQLLEERHFFFHNTIGEGFYIAALKKVSCKGGGVKIKPGKFEKAPNTASYLCSSNFKFIKTGDAISAVPSGDADIYYWFNSNFRVLKCGTEVAILKGKDEIPSHSLALSKIIDKSKVVSCDVDYNRALSYLRKEAIVLSDAPKGYILITYNDAPLGWVKNIGNRANNLYPEYWRIRKS